MTSADLTHLESILYAQVSTTRAEIWILKIASEEKRADIYNLRIQLLEHARISGASITGTKRGKEIELDSLVSTLEGECKALEERIKGNEGLKCRRQRKRPDLE